jgi:hypothetical protein
LWPELTVGMRTASWKVRTEQSNENLNEFEGWDRLGRTDDGQGLERVFLSGKVGRTKTMKIKTNVNAGVAPGPCRQ